MRNILRITFINLIDFFKPIWILIYCGVIILISFIGMKWPGTINNTSNTVYYVYGNNYTSSSSISLISLIIYILPSLVLLTNNGKNLENETYSDLYILNRCKSLSYWLYARVISMFMVSFLISILSLSFTIIINILINFYFVPPSVNIELIALFGSIIIRFFFILLMQQCIYLKTRSSSLSLIITIAFQVLIWLIGTERCIFLGYISFDKTRISEFIPALALSAVYITILTFYFKRTVYKKDF